MSCYFDTKADQTQHIYLATGHESFFDWTFLVIYPDRLRLVDKKGGVFNIENVAPLGARHVIRRVRAHPRHGDASVDQEACGPEAVG